MVLASSTDSSKLTVLCAPGASFSPDPALNDPMVPAVKTLGINPVELAHADREIGLGRLDQQMVVIGHQAVGVADPVIAAHHARERAQKQLAVGVGKNTFCRALPRPSDDKPRREILTAAGAP
jgi:hypothetical protein